MNQRLHSDAIQIVSSSIRAVLPDEAVKRAMAQLPEVTGRIVLIAAGKAAWQMAKAAVSVRPDIREGIVITKYGHVKGEIPGITCLEAGHAVPDARSFAATENAIAMAGSLTNDDLVLFLLSGGGSALFESPLIPGDELADITSQLLSCGADITEINTIRKRLSAVKGGRFALVCEPAQVFTIVLSDIVGDPLDMIASGPAYPDSSTCEDAMSITKKYALRMSADARDCLLRETPSTLQNVQTLVTGSVREFCAAAAKSCSSLGYTPYILTDHLVSEARASGQEFGELAAAIAAGKPLLKGDVFSEEEVSVLAEQFALPEDPACAAHPSLTEDPARMNRPEKIALIAGGETVVHLTGTGKGGRNQEFALAAAPAVRGIPGVCVCSVGSDGTDGPTDAAGGYVDGDTCDSLDSLGISVSQVLAANDSYHALAKTSGLIITGPTGTNVNDVAVALLKA